MITFTPIELLGLPPDIYYSLKGKNIDSIEDVIKGNNKIEDEYEILKEYLSERNIII